jgi:hypothetical protein
MREKELEYLRNELNQLLRFRVYRRQPQFYLVPGAHIRGAVLLGRRLVCGSAGVRWRPVPKNRSRFRAGF